MNIDPTPFLDLLRDIDKGVRMKSLPGSIKATNLDGTNIGSTPPTLTTPIPGKTTVVTSGTRVQLASNTCKTVVIKAGLANTGTIYLGDVTVASTAGLELAAGDSYSADVSNTNLFYVDASSNGQLVTWLALN